MSRRIVMRDFGLGSAVWTVMGLSILAGILLGVAGTLFVLLLTGTVT